MFILNSLTYAYPGRPAALKGASGRVPKGLTLLAGPNAGGKTTLLRLLAGLAAPQGGTVARAGSGASAAPAILRKAAKMVMQDAETQILGARVGEDVMLGAATAPDRDGFAESARRLADRFGLAAYWGEPVETLSHGQKKKLCLLHALLADPELLLLDEPFAGLDYPAARELRALVGEIRAEGRNLLVAVHDLEPLFDLADWLVVVDGGMVRAEGKPDSLRDELVKWSVRPPGGGWS